MPKPKPLKFIIEGPVTIGKLQGPYEASILNRKTWRRRSYYLDWLVKRIGADKHPDDVFTFDVEICRDKAKDQRNAYFARTILIAGRQFWEWMRDMEFCKTNPWRYVRQNMTHEEPVVVVVK